MSAHESLCVFCAFRCPRRPEKSIWSPVPGITSSSVPPDLNTETELGRNKKHSLPLSHLSSLLFLYEYLLGSSIILKIIVKSLLGIANVFNRSRFDISIYLIGLLHDNNENHCFPILSVFSYTFIILYKS